MRILLIKPAWFDEKGVYSKYKYMRFSPINLGIIASLSEGHEVTIVDQDVQEVPFHESFDIVGITTTTFNSEKAYRLCKVFKDKGTFTVLGGVHASLIPEECIKHCDSVVVGEAECSWPQLLKDFENGNVKKIYNGKFIENLDLSPIPKRSNLLDREIACIEATRGCNNNCEFCYLPKMPWKKYRKKTVKRFGIEFSQLRQGRIFFVDDNLFEERDYILSLCDEIKKYNKKWSVQAPTEIAFDSKLLRKLKEAGLYHVFMGFQSIVQSNLDNNKVSNRVRDYKRIVRNMHRFDISVCGFFIFGFDNDTKESIQKTVDMIKEIELDDAFLYILTPYPGTSIYNKFIEQGRLIKEACREKYDWQNPVFKPKNMSANELKKYVNKAREDLRDYFNMRQKMFLGARVNQSS